MAGVLLDLEQGCPFHGLDRGQCLGSIQMVGILGGIKPIC